MSKLTNNETFYLTIFVIGVISLSLGLLHIISVLFNSTAKIIIYLFIGAVCFAYGSIKYNKL